MLKHSAINLCFYVALLATKHAYFLPLPAGMPENIPLIIEPE